MSDEPPGRSGWTTSIGLMAGIRANESAAWDRFAALYGALFDHWFSRAGLPESEWADVRQEVFLAVVRGLDGFREGPPSGSFRGWLRVIVSHKLVDRARVRVPTPNSPALDQFAAPCREESGEPSEYRLVFQRALDLIRTDFESATWQAFWWVAVEDRAPAEVAAELGLSLNAVYLAKARVVRRLREEFADVLEDRPPEAPTP